MTKILMAVALGAVLCAPLVYGNDIKLTLKVTGMTCAGCAAGVEKLFKQVEGVTAADVSFEKGQAAVTFDSARITAEKLIASVVKAAGSSYTFKAENEAELLTKAPQIFCSGKSAGQLCDHGTARAFKLSGEKRAAWIQAANRYNLAVKAATKQILEEARQTLSAEEFVLVEKWLGKGVNIEINQQLAKETTREPGK